MQMLPALGRRFEKLEWQKGKLLAELTQWPASRLCFRPNPEGWSALEVLDHLIKVEKGILDAVREQLAGGSPITFTNRAGAWLVISVMHSPLRVRVPDKVRFVLPQTENDLAELAANWCEIRQQLGNLLKSLPPSHLRCGLFQHPVSGWMNIGSTLAFLSAHLHHHGYQLKRLKTAALND
jgi:hypothetical protein